MTDNDVTATVADLTLEEKASLTSGLNFWHTKPVERVGIPSIMMTDGPHGLRKQAETSDHLGMGVSVPATCFPAAGTLAATAAAWPGFFLPDLSQARRDPPREAGPH